MKNKKKLLAMLLIGAAVGMSVLALNGCTNDGNNDDSTDTDIVDPDVPLGSGGCEHTGVSHVEAVNAGCETGGNKEYWFCDDCDTYFSDADLTVKTSLAGVTLGSVGHSYGEFEYDYTAKKYVKTCGRDKTHFIEEEAGTENYPYLANDSASLLSAIEAGGYVKLAEDIDLTETEGTDTTTYYSMRNDTSIDLNGHKITTKKGFSSGVNDKNNFEADLNPIVTVKNGTIERVSNSNIAALTAADCGELVIINCTVVSTGDTAVSIFDQGKVTATDSTLKGVYYGFGSNAGAGNYSNAIYAKLENCKLDAQYAGLLWNIPATLVVENCEISGIGQAVIARGGNITVSDSTLTKRAGVVGVDGNAAINCDTTTYPKYETSNWGGGSNVPGYALVVGNRSSSYQYATSLTLNNVKVVVEEEADAGKYVYAYGNTNKTAGEPAYGATITYDEKCELGNIVLGDEGLAGGSNVTVHAPVAESELAA